MLVLSLVPDGGTRLEEVLNAAGSSGFVVAVLAGWLLIDGVLLLLALGRFQRARLLLD